MAIRRDSFRKSTSIEYMKIFLIYQVFRDWGQSCIDRDFFQWMIHNQHVHELNVNVNSK